MKQLTLVLLAVALPVAAAAQATPERRAEVAERGKAVMPFDLSKTHHVFQDQADGGLQTVTANTPGDTLQIRLIREHLRSEAEKFSRGDFADPMAIHGHTMPGIAELRAGAARITVEYADTAGGARVRYRAKEAALVAALHRWFAAQRMDHGVP